MSSHAVLIALSLVVLTAVHAYSYYYDPNSGRKKHSHVAYVLWSNFQVYM